jgi:hypothetical protein
VIDGWINGVGEVLSFRGIIYCGYYKDLALKLMFVFLYLAEFEFFATSRVEVVRTARLV